MTDQPITDEMPDTWVRDLTRAIEAYDHTITDAHETAITITLTPRAMQHLDADPGEELYIGWSERAGIDWGLGHHGHVPDPQPLPAVTVTEIAARVHLLLTTGRPA